MKETHLLLLALLQMTQAYALFPDTFPSCLKGNITFDISNIYNIVANVVSPDGCQEQCSADPDCSAFTWASAFAPLYPLTCTMFSQMSDITTPCEECVSGPPECKCNIPGECVIVDDNIIDIVSQVDSINQCELLCSDNSMCKFYTYLGEGNYLRHTCLLYSGCEVFTTDCDDCTTGKFECDICRFGNMLPDGSCACGEDWLLFGNHCYMNLNNNEQGYKNIENCRDECSSLGGMLASIHSKEENEFIFSLIRPHRNYGLTWIGASWVSFRVYEWDDSTPWDYENWYSGQGLAQSNSCVRLGHYEDSPEKWGDGVCESGTSHDCICKRDV